jgi:hypothetical protein
MTPPARSHCSDYPIQPVFTAHRCFLPPSLARVIPHIFRITARTFHSAVAMEDQFFTAPFMVVGANLNEAELADQVQLILRAADAFDGRDHVMSEAACKLHVWGTADSAARNQPGFVPTSTSAA